MAETRGHDGLAVWAITPQGAGLARKIADLFPQASLFTGNAVDPAPEGALPFQCLSVAMKEQYFRFSAHVFVMAAGIATRMVAPYVNSKLTDPAVVVVDDLGKFSISLLSGHLGGANELAQKVADAIGAVPVITTATDIHRLPAIDMVAKSHGLMIETPGRVKTIGMELLKGKRVWRHDPLGLLSRELGKYSVEAKYPFPDSSPGIFVDYRQMPISDSVLVLRPRFLSVGVGCNRGTGLEELRSVIGTVFEKFRLSINSIEQLSSIEAKADEDGLLALASYWMVPIRFFGKDALKSAGPTPTPSKMVEKHMGVASVCEAAAILASEKGSLLVPKQVSGNVTVAVACRHCISSGLAPEDRST